MISRKTSIITRWRGGATTMANLWPSTGTVNTVSTTSTFRDLACSGRVVEKKGFSLSFSLSLSLSLSLFKSILSCLATLDGAWSIDRSACDRWQASPNVLRDAKESMYTVSLKRSTEPVVRESLEARGRSWRMYICWISEW